MAAIAASDAACCWALGQRNDESHDAAPRLLAQVRGGRSASNALARVLAIKSKVQYVGGKTTANDVVSSLKWARAVVVFADSVLD